MSLRKTTLLINLKIHSAYHKYFDQKEYTLDAFNADSINDYLRAVHPKFNAYIKQIENGTSDEFYGLVDKDFKVIEPDALGIKKFREGETVYLAPMVVGGGGKRGGLLFLALFAVVAAPMLAAQLGATAGAGAGSACAAGEAGSAAVSASLGGSGGMTLGSFAKAFGNMNPILRSIVTNIGLAVVSSLLTKKPKNTQQTESTTRENGMFGSLTNTTTSGTPVPLHYGQVRVAGQFLSGYINSEEHGKNDLIRVGDQF